MKQFMMIGSSVLPMPPVKGGAVESLLDILMKQNEIHHQFRFIYISPYSCEAEKEAARFQYTEFLYIRKTKWEEFLCPLLNLASRVLRKLTGIDLEVENRLFFRKAQEYLHKMEYDRLLIENSQSMLKLSDQSGIAGEKIIYHLHNEWKLQGNINWGPILERICGVIHVSEYIWRQMAGYYPDIQKKSHVLPNCIEKERFNPAHVAGKRESLRKRFGISDKDRVLIYMGRLAEEKGVRELLKAFRQIKGMNVKLVLIGSSWFGGNKKNSYVRELERLAEGDGRILFTGYVAHSQMPEYLSMGDIAVLPSIWEEPSLLAVLESSAMGLPVITTRRGGIPENCTEASAIILDFQTPEELVEQLVKSITELLGDEKRREEMGAEGIKSVAKRNEENYYRYFSRLMERI